MLGIRKALLDAFTKPLNVLHINGKQVHLVEHFDLNLPFIERLFHLHSATIETEVEPSLVRDIISRGIHLFKSIVAAIISDYLNLLCLQKVVEDPFSKVGRQIAEQELALACQLPKRNAVDSLIVRSVWVAKLAKQRIDTLKQEGRGFILRVVPIGISDLIVAYRLIEVLVEEDSVLKSVRAES